MAHQDRASLDLFQKSRRADEAGRVGLHLEHDLGVGAGTALTGENHQSCARARGQPGEA